jgi:hypothetical protein
MPYAFYAVLDALPQIALAAILPIVGIAFVSLMIKVTRPVAPAKPVAAE